MIDAEIGVICLECACGRRSWIRTSEVGFRTLSELSGRLQCRACGGREVDIGYASDTGLARRPPEDLWATVEQWTHDGNKIEEVLAKASNLGIARAAYEQAVIERPGRNITFRHFCRVIRSTDRDEREREMERQRLTFLAKNPRAEGDG